MKMHGYTTARVYEGHLRVNSCGKHWSGSSDFESSRPNGRVDYSIYYSLSGVIHCNTDSGITLVPEGSILLYPPNMPQHFFIKADAHAVVNWAHFSGNATELLTEIVGNEPVIISIGDKKQFESAYEKMITVYYKRSPFFMDVCAGYMAVLLAIIAQSNLQNNAVLRATRNDNLELILSLMYREYSHPIDIKKYADICCVSEDHFIRMFKSYTGLPPYRYLLKIRIEYAKELLENTSISVTECAETVGFCSVAHFSRTFKKFTGHSPSYYQKQ